MTFEENPFRILNVSIYDTKATIVERADELSFADPDDEKIFAQAQDILINPRKRIAAEMRWFVGCSRDEEQDWIYCLLNNRIVRGGFNQSLAELNFQIYLMENESWLLNERCILLINSLYSDLDVKEIRDIINASRRKSKFPAVNDTKAIADELKNMRDEIRSKIQACLKEMTHHERVKCTTKIEDSLEYADVDTISGVVVEDFFDSYKLEMSAFLDETAEKILALSNKFEFNFKAEFSQYLYELEPQLTAFVEAKQPLDKFSILLGTNDFSDSEEIFYSVRATAIDLYNEKDLVDYPLKITRLLAEKFSYLPKLAEMIRKDTAFLEEAKKNRPTQTFLNSRAALKAIITAIDKELNFDKDFIHAHGNINFYLNVFKKRHEVTLLEIMSRTTYKPDERQILNSMAASIYLSVGNAITWTLNAEWGLPLSLNSRIKLTYELFQRALVYAEASGDAELITLARKRVDEWKKFSEQVENEIKAKETKENSDSFGCLIWIIIIVVFFLCTR